MNYFPSLVRQQDGSQGLCCSLFGDLNQARLCIQYLGHMGSLLFLCGWEKLCAVLSVQVSLRAKL